MRRPAEQAAALIWAIILMVVLAAITASFAMIVQRSGERTKDASRRVTNSATVQTATTRIALGLQNDLGSEQDSFTFTDADLAALVSTTAGAQVHPDPATLKDLPTEYRTTGGIWEHYEVGGTTKLRSLGDLPTNAVVEEGAALQVDPTVCASAGLPAATCASGSVGAYWQVFRVVEPDITGYIAPNLVVFLRTWIGSKQDGVWSKASYARVEMRPGRFADFQLITDGNIHVANGAKLNGPVHSNGFDDASYGLVAPPPAPYLPAPPAPGQPKTGWVYVAAGVDCSSGAPSITIRDGVINGPGSAACNVQGRNGQSISFLRTIDAIDRIADAGAAGVPGTRPTFTAPSRRGDERGRASYDTAWRVRLAGNQMQVWYPDGTYYTTVPLGRSNAFVFDEDVRISGTAAADIRVTVAANRDGDAPATIFVEGDILKGDQKSSAIGLLAQGDIVIWQRPGSDCTVRKVQAALVAATGGITIPTQYTTSEFQSNAPRCSLPLRLHGSIAGHRPPILYWNWPTTTSSGGWSGYTNREYFWDPQLKRNPPPMFPLTGNWQATSTRDANVDCLFTRMEDPSCR